MSALPTRTALCASHWASPICCVCAIGANCAPFAQLIRGKNSRKDIARRIANGTAAQIEAKDREAFLEIASTELAGLGAANFARYQARPSEFQARQEVWNAK